jgi:hypothetical protein
MMSAPLRLRTQLKLRARTKGQQRPRMLHILVLVKPVYSSVEAYFT